MSNSKLKIVEKQIFPVKITDFQRAEHRYARHDCIVPNGLTKKDLENPELWVNVAPQLNKGFGFDEIRAVSMDESLVAYLIVTFSQGTDARLKVINIVELEPVGEIDAPQGKYDVKLLGVKKYVLFNTITGEHIKTGIATKVEAYKELDDYLKALRR